MLYTEESARANLRNRQGQRVFYLGPNDRLTAAAREWLAKEKIPILPAEEAKQTRYRLENGAYLEEKPEHMTHLNAEILVPKTHPRIIFRGKMDTLEGELLLCQRKVKEAEKDLGEILSLARQILRCDVLEEPLKWEKLCGLTEAEQRKRSHFPQDYYGQPHFMPCVEDGEAVLQLNRVRCAAREAELAGAEAFTDPQGNPTRPDILKALNRMSSMLYILMIQWKSR